MRGAMSAKTPPDPWANFPGGNPFGPQGPFGPGSPFGKDPFANMDEWFRQMGVDPGDFRRLVDEMQRSLQDALRGMGDDPTKTFMTGFHVRVGPDGKPHISSFGNKPSVKPAPGGGLPKVDPGDREPLTDVIEEGSQIAITMELPGVDKKDIDLHMTEEQLEVSVDTERRKYHKRVRLPARVDPATTKATFKNGILDVSVEKIRDPTAAGMRINVD